MTATSRTYAIDVADLTGEGLVDYLAAVDACLNKHSLRGRYARAVAHGSQRLSGADLKGKARTYGAHYARQREYVLAALVAEGVAHEAVGPHNRRYLTPGPRPVA